MAGKGIPRSFPAIDFAQGQSRVRPSAFGSPICRPAAASGPGTLTVFRDETEFVAWVRRFAPAEGGRVKVGIGDDAALVSMARGQELILKADFSLEGVHFTRALYPPRSVGHRALARSLSDIAAMGGAPRFALISLAISPQTTRRWIHGLYAGLGALAAKFDVVVVGGDTAVVRGSAAIDVIVAGEVRRGRALLRSGARPGDQLFVSGTLGMSALGLQLLKTRRGRPDTDARRAIQAHLYPQPQCALGRFLSEKRLASALIDVSDGLSTDLAHLSEASGIGACVWANCIPLPERRNAHRAGKDGLLDLALHGGEDYQLLFTVPPGKVARVPSRFQGVPVRRIGEIRRSKGLWLVRLDGKKSILRPLGYDHFRKRA